MSDPTHVRIIDALVEGEIGVGERVERFGLTQSAISHQLRGLNNKRLIRTRKLGRNVFNCLDDEHAAELFACGLDLGDDYFTQGKPHPMIDARERYKRILKEAEDPEVAILLLDFLLGDISSSDPVGDLIEAIRQAQARAAQRGGRLTAAASVCGTDQDPQDLEKQKSSLQEAGLFTLPTSALAAGFCRDLLQMAGGR